MAPCWWWSVRKLPEQGPGALAWSLALISLALPWIGLALVLYGGILIVRGAPDGWFTLLAGLVALAADVGIDLVWANPRVSHSDEPSLNARARQLAGRACIVTETISAGRGKVRIDDTEWAAEGADTPAGTRVRVAGSHGTILLVEPDSTQT